MPVLETNPTAPQQADNKLSFFDNILFWASFSVNFIFRPKFFELLVMVIALVVLWGAL